MKLHQYEAENVKTKQKWIVDLLLVSCLGALPGEVAQLTFISYRNQKKKIR